MRLQLLGTEQFPAISFKRARYDSTLTAVVLQWEYAGEGDYYFVLYRSIAGEPLERYKSFEKGTNEWKDLFVDNIDKGYQYAIQAVYKNNSKLTRLTEGVRVTR